MIQMVVLPIIRRLIRTESRMHLILALLTGSGNRLGIMHLRITRFLVVMKLMAARRSRIMLIGK